MGERQAMLSKRVSEALAAGIAYPLAAEYDVEAKVKLSSNESPFGPSPKVIKAVVQEARRLSRYPDPEAKELKRAISDYLKVDVDCIAIGNGSDELLDLICKAFLDPGERAVIPVPTFAMYEIACRVNGGVPKFVELEDFRWDASSLVDALVDAKLAFIGRPNNPTGNGLSSRGVRRLLASGKLIVVDEAYAEFAGYTLANLAARKENLLVLRTFSKAFGLAGLRVGYAIGAPEMVKVLERIRMPFNVNRLAQAAAVAALRDLPYVRRVVASLRRGREYLRRELSKLGMRVLPSEANFVMADVRPLGLSAQELCSSLARRGILIRDLSGFRGAGEGYVRISVGTREENEQLVEGIKQIKEVVGP
ncbi:MAG: histidinol-phosphate transaminase [Hadesarchaea archaeon]|nr:histidinol-phosphate transaminase [Hadesarchaea archaeon]